MMKEIPFALGAGSFWGVGAIIFKVTLASFSLLGFLAFLFCGIAGFVLFQAALKLGTATEVNALMIIALVSIPMLFGIFIHREMLSLIEMVGVGFLLTGAFLIILRQDKNRQIS